MPSRTHLRAFFSRVREERGIALVMALGVMLVLALALGAVLALSSGSARHASRSNADEKAFALAESGVSAGASVLAAQANPDTWPSYASLTSAQRTLTVGGNSVLWSASGPTSCGAKCALWTIYGTSSVQNPTGPTAAAVSRTVSKQLQVTWSGGFGLDSSFIYSFGDFNFNGGQNGVLQEPIITDGNFKATQGRVDASATPFSIRGIIDISGGNTTAMPPSGTRYGTGIGTQLAAAMTTTSTQARVTSVSDFPSSGVTKIDQEWMSYSGKGTTAAVCTLVAPPCLTGLTRGIVSGYPAAAHSSGAFVDSPAPATLTANLPAAQTSVMNVSSITGLGTDICTACTYAGMVKVDDGPGPTTQLPEYVMYTGVSTTACGSGPAPCLTGLKRGQLSQYPARDHTGCVTGCTAETVDGRIGEIHSSTPPTGGCLTKSACDDIRAAAPMDASLTQDDPNFTPPVYNVANSQAWSAPGPNHLPSPACTIGAVANPFTTTTNPYYNGATVNLTPGTAYDCVATGGQFPPPAPSSGELKWTPPSGTTPGVLKVRGVVYLPTNVTISSDLVFDAPAPGSTMFIGGTFSVSNSPSICGKVVTFTLPVTCSGSWNPSVDNTVAFVSLNAPAPYNASPYTVASHNYTLGSSPLYFQGMLYTQGNLTKTGGSGDQVSGTIFANVINWSGGGASVAPGILTLPYGSGSAVTYVVSYVDGSFSG